MSRFRLYTTHAQALKWLVLTGILVALFGASSLPSLVYLGVAPLVFPPILLFSVTMAGLLPALANFALMMLGAFSVFKTEGLWFALYLLPFTLAFWYCVEKGVPFFKTAAITCAAFVFSLALLFFILQKQAGGALYSAAANAAVTGLENMPARDNLLYTLWQSGFLTHGLPGDTQAIVTDNLGGWTFNPAVLSEFYKQISSRLTALLSTFFPSMLTGYSIILSLPIMGLAIKMGVRRDLSPRLDMPPFSKWFIPKSQNPLMLILAAGYFLASFSNNIVLQTTGQLMYNVFSTLFLIQGLALLNSILKNRGAKPLIRFILLVLLMVILSPAALILGVFDQLTDPRKLRAPTDPNEMNKRV